MRLAKLKPWLLVATLLAALPQARATLVVGAPIDVIGNLSLTQFTNFGYGTNNYKDWGNEPSIAVNPLNPNQMVVSSFSYGTSSTSSGANIFYSTNGGTSWTSQFSVPAPAAGVGTPNDWRFLYDANGRLQTASLAGCNTCNVYAGSTNDPTSLAAFSWSGGGAKINNAASLNNADQPWIAVSPGKVFVAYDDFHSNTGERLVVSNNGGTTFTVDTAMNNGPQLNFVNPGTRIATDASGTVYGVFGVGDSTASHGQGLHQVDYYLNRSRDGGVTWDFNASSAIGGIKYGSGLSAQLDNAGTQASNTWFAGVNDLRGNITAVAASADGSHIYATFGARDGNNVDRIYLVEFHAVGNTLVASAPTLLSVAGQRAALPSLTVLANGMVVAMYDAYSAADGKVHVHIASSVDFGASIDTDVDAYNFAPLTLAQATGSTSSNREFGDYDFITSVGNSFYSAFAGLGNVNAGGINTTGLIDPFILVGTGALPVPEIGSAWMMLGGLAGLVSVARRRRAGRTCRA